VCLSALFLTHTHHPSSLSLSPSLLVGVKRVTSGDLCVSSFTAPLLPLGGTCASLTSKSLPQRCSDVHCCLLKNLPGDCRHRRRCPIIPCVLLPVLMDHSHDAGLQGAVLRATRVRRWWWRRYGWLQGKERRLWGLCINTTPNGSWVMNYTPKHTLNLISASTNTD